MYVRQAVKDAQACSPAVFYQKHPLCSAEICPFPGSAGQRLIEVKESQTYLVVPDDK